jgi:nucleoside-diphosphate-sugar epimerase
MKVNRHNIPYNNVLVTGSFGYIGVNLVNYINEHTDLNVYHADKSKGIGVEHLETLKNVDFIVHLAALPGVLNCKRNFDGAVVDNICSAFSVFNTAYKNKVPVIFTSSQAAKFWDNNLYATIKAVIEIEARRLNGIGGDIRVIRLSNVYGGVDYFQRKLTVISKFVKAIEADEGFIINGDGSQIRDFVSVLDVCRAICMYMEKDYGYNFPIDIGSGKGFSILEIAKLFNWPYAFEPNSDLVGPAESVIDPSKAKELLGFEAEHSLEDFIDNMKQVLQMPT